MEWNKSAIAFKNTYGEAGFAAWLDLSSAADNFEGEQRCREEWENIKVRSDDAQRLTIASYVADAKELSWRPDRRNNHGTRSSGVSGSGDSAASKDKSADLPTSVHPAARAVQLAEDAGDEFWLDQEDKPHVSFTVQLGEGRTTIRNARVGSSDYKSVLAHRFYESARNKVLSSEHATIAATLLEYRAKESGVRHFAALRVGEHNGKVYVDRGTVDGGAIEIDPAGWRQIDAPPVRFIRGTRGELPVPEAEGSREDFKRHFNLTDDDLTRLLGFLIGTFNVGASYAMLLTDGPQGAGKSMLNDKAVGLVDPPRQAKSARMSFNPKEEDLHLGAVGVHVPYFDNVSSFSGDAADALCRMSTGGGSGRRTLYSNDQYTQVVVTRPVIITCIGSPTSRLDLLSRSVRITALPLGEKRRTEKAVMRAFETDRPRMIGYLFSCVSAAIRNRSAVEEAVERGDFQLPRMADFAEFVEGAAEVLGLQRGEFSDLLDRGQTAMQTEAVLGHPVGAALMIYFSRSG
ncbi:MAG: PriCT-2 domain-containing protein, partial [Pseudomonadota bacterium]|nr:PriCT-2 domain-containing protein [Pseudomonadota bacterium]